MSKLSRRIRRRKMQQSKRHRGPCFVEGCSNRGTLKHHCTLCEGKNKEFVVQFCFAHAPEATAKMKKHCMLKHAGVLPAWIANQLRGGA